MWESPIYKFKKKIIDDNGKSKDIDISVDVTGSAPTMKEPGDYLEGVFNILVENKTPEKTLILDVGAAKLRNTLYLLKKGFKVYAVEFPELAKRMPQAKTNWAEAEKFQNFKKLVFPKDLFKLKEKCDIILLINITNVMPIPDERLVLLSLCKEKIRNKGLLLWYSWRDLAANPDKYTEKTKLNDGYFKGEGREYKTFHGEWNRDHVMEMLISCGFSANKDISLGNVGNNQAYIFSPDESVLIEKYLELEEIKKGGKKRDPNIILKETEKINFPRVYLEELKQIPTGRNTATKFHRLSVRLMATIFDYQLKNPVVEKEINEGRGYIDIKFQNRNNPGFFKNIKDLRDIKCPWVSAECKNYEYDLKNPEFDQLSERLDKIRGMFGLLICRKIADKKRVIGHCKDKLRQEKYIIVLDDKDMENLVNLKLKESNEAVDDYMEKKLEEVTD